MSREKFFIYDLYRYFYPNDSVSHIGFLQKLRIVVLTQAVWATAVYRAGRWCVLNRSRLGFLGRILIFLLSVIQKVVEIMTGIDLPFGAQIGRGFYIGHFGQIIVSERAVLGEFCNISQGVTIGVAGRGGEQHAPVIGDRVYIAPGAKLFGKVSVGNDVAIGANAVVTRDLPDNSVAVGVPAKVISQDSSKDFVNFNRSRMGLDNE